MRGNAAKLSKAAGVTLCPTFVAMVKSGQLRYHMNWIHLDGKTNNK